MCRFANPDGSCTHPEDKPAAVIVRGSCTRASWPQRLSELVSSQCGRAVKLSPCAVPCAAPGTMRVQSRLAECAPEVWEQIMAFAAEHNLSVVPAHG